MKLSEFKYSLPKKSIAKFPASPRHDSKMMVLNKETGNTEDKHFYDIVDMFKKGDCLVLNTTKVFPARLYGIKEKTNAEILWLC
jgi:S-adenosylmethionine:tRNA ribosyltransferase-isomerase